MSGKSDRLASLLVALALAAGIAGVGGCTAGNDVKSAAGNAVKEGKKAAKSAGDEAKKAGEKAVDEAVPLVQIHERRDRGK